MMFTEYVTKPGDRWDSISYKAYGTISKMNDIIIANPEIPIDPVLPEGVTIRIPILEKETIATSSLPPWKR